VQFRITRHSGGAARAPADALDLLWQRLGADCDEVSFAKAGDEIRATATEDQPASMEWNERADISRCVVLDILRSVCEQAAELEWDWFAVSSGN
jgi:hypothetical protein